MPAAPVTLGRLGRGAKRALLTEMMTCLPQARLQAKRSANPLSRPSAPETTMTEHLQSPVVTNMLPDRLISEIMPVAAADWFTISTRPSPAWETQCCAAVSLPHPVGPPTTRSEGLPARKTRMRRHILPNVSSICVSRSRFLFATTATVGATLLEGVGEHEGPRVGLKTKEA